MDKSAVMMYAARNPMVGVRELQVLNNAFPGWARPNAESSTASLIAQAAGAIATLHVAAVADQKWRGAWLDRLALCAATGSLAAIDLPEDQSVIRDALLLLPSGSLDPGPPGRIYSLWRWFSTRSPVDREEDLAEEATRRKLTWGEDLQALWRFRATLAISESPVVAAVMVATAPVTLKRASRPLAFLIADATLAARARWPYGVPLLATLAASQRLGGAGGSTETEAWRATHYHAYARAAAAAHDLYGAMGDRAAALMGIEGLRAKGAAPILAALLSNDAVRAGGPDVTLPGGLVITQRARRRLLEKLAGEKLIRELTGRSTSRLYGI